jgi:hypothetical protein
VIILTPSTSYLGADVGLGLMVGRQDLDRAAEHLAARVLGGILDRQLHGFDFAGRQVAIDAREAFHDADLERRRRLGLGDRHHAYGSETGEGNSRADIANRFTNTHTLILPDTVFLPATRRVSSGEMGDAPVLDVPRAWRALDSDAKLRLIRRHRGEAGWPKKK